MNEMAKMKYAYYSQCSNHVETPNSLIAQLKSLLNDLKEICALMTSHCKTHYVVGHTRSSVCSDVCVVTFSLTSELTEIDLRISFLTLIHGSRKKLSTLNVSTKLHASKIRRRLFHSGGIAKKPCSFRKLKLATESS